MLLVSCARPSVEELTARSATLILVERSNNLCGQTFAIDHDGQGWYERGCENGKPKLAPTRTVPRAERDAIAAMLAALDDAPCVSTVPQYDREGFQTYFTLKGATGSRIVLGCVVGPDGTKSLVPAARAVLDRVVKATQP